MLFDQIRGGFEESACCRQETVLIMAVWKEGEGGGVGGVEGGPSRTINREEFKLKGSERRGVKNNKKAFRTRRHLHTQSAHQLLFTSTAVLQVSS